MKKENGWRNYILDGYRIQIAPGRWRNVTVYFRANWPLIKLRGFDIWDHDMKHIGWFEPQQLGLAETRMLLSWMRGKKAKWVQIRSQ